MRGFTVQWRIRLICNRSFLYQSSIHVEVAFSSIRVTVVISHLMSFLRCFERLRMRYENEVCASPIEQIYYLLKYFAMTLICEPAWLGDYSRLHMLQIH